MNEDKLKEIVEKVNQISSDVKAEVVINDIIRNGVLNEEDFKVSPMGQFKRAFDFDIDKAQLEVNHLDYSYINFLLNRDGFYDILPQAMNHGQPHSELQKDVEDMVDDYKKINTQRKEAQLFYNPYENELFGFLIQIENKEQQLLSSFNKGLPNEILLKFWDIPRDIPEKILSKYLKILPHLHEIIGDTALCVELLSFILEEEITYQVKKYKLVDDNENQTSLSELQLGVNSITGNSFIDYGYYLNLNIGPIQNSNYIDFLPNQKYSSFLDDFYSRFFPVEVEINTNLVINSEEEKLDMSNEKNFLGYSTRI